MRLGYHSITWGGVVGEPTGVTSIKNLHYRSNGSIVQAVRDIAAAGYEGIEIFDGNLADYAARWWSVQQPYLEIAAQRASCVAVHTLRERRRSTQPFGRGSRIIGRQEG